MTTAQTVTLLWPCSISTTTSVQCVTVVKSAVGDGECDIKSDRDSYPVSQQ